MRVINVVEISDNSVLSIESFGVYDESKAQEQSEKVEAIFKAKARENGCFLTDEELEGCVEDGYWYRSDYAVNIVWTNIEP